ncbi:MAG TPA: Mur ligase family protein [Clostridiales bacterium]|nr:Mur ligase family protein [Clostridiales bacterium]
MIIAGLAGYGSYQVQTADLIYTILNSYDKKTSFLDCKSLEEFSTSKLKAYINEIGKNGTDYLILKIDLSDFDPELFEYLQEYLQFDIILYNNETDKFLDFDASAYMESIEKLMPFLSEKGIVIINEDFKEAWLPVDNFEYQIVTYGFNLKAGVTTSSISDTLFGSELMFYQQQTIRTINGKIITPQEYRVYIEKKIMDIYIILGAVTFAIVSGVDPSRNLSIIMPYEAMNVNIASNNEC